ncbi:hypothetical protein [Streptomyces acidiscabies]|uniref:hypothetical protein n=1 Tax=Streptomyces acidiscabies TaxID=42234 RepID=UPI0038F77F0E
MNRDALTADAPPASLWAVCGHCGRWTRAAVELPGPGPVRYACPDCVLLAGAGPGAGTGSH